MKARKETKGRESYIGRGRPEREALFRPWYEKEPLCNFIAFYNSRDENCFLFLESVRSGDARQSLLFLCPSY